MYRLPRTNVSCLYYLSRSAHSYDYGYEFLRRLRLIHDTKHSATRHSKSLIKPNSRLTDVSTEAPICLETSTVYDQQLQSSLSYLHGLSRSASGIHGVHVNSKNAQNLSVVGQARAGVSVARRTPHWRYPAQREFGTTQAGRMCKAEDPQEVKTNGTLRDGVKPDKGTDLHNYHLAGIDFSSGFLQAYAQQTNTEASQHIDSTTLKQAEQRRLEVVHRSQRKIDLSYRDVQGREAATSINGRIATSKTIPSSFRGNTGLRHILHGYINHIKPILERKTDLCDQDDTAICWLKTLSSAKTIHFLQQRGYDTGDVVSWGWILSAESGTQSVRRYVLYLESKRRETRPELPVFVLLQILRFEHIDAKSLHLLILYVEASINHGSRWDKSSAAILLVRLLRHARMTRASFHERIANLAPCVLPFEVEGNLHVDARRLSHFYNRFLSLLALPVARHPFLSVDAQQRAQLKIARSMMDSPLQIQLNREGYRALARLQLMHKKTSDEHQWSSVKAPSWPPWRRDELGIDARIEYPGRQSRVAKVIKRLLEAGYGPESMEQEAQILAGWDVDKSPTVQVRRIPRSRPLSWIRELFSKSSSTEAMIDHHIWAARVAATRSVREAWMCFYSYMNVTTNQKRQLRVYHEMFCKLFARVQQTEQKATPSPGDGKEVFTDPISPRDLVYVHKEPPSIHELYAQMLQDGIRPAGRLLASLLDNAQTLKQGLAYISDSTLTEVKKDLLLHPEKYPHYFIRSMYPTLPNYLFSGYIGLVTKCANPDNVDVFFPGSGSAEESNLVPRTAAKSLYYGMMWMQICRPKYMPAYHALLEGICAQATSRRLQNDVNSSRRYSYSELWQMTKELLDQLVREDLHVDLTCFRKVVLLVRNSMIRAPSQFTSNDRVFLDAVPRVRSVFVDAIQGRIEGGKLHLPAGPLDLDQQPYWKDMESLILLLGFGHDYESIIIVLKWLRQEEKHLDCLNGGGYKVQRLTCAVRVALEASWARGNIPRASTKQIQQIKVLVEDWSWPEDVDVEEYMKFHSTWLEAMRTAAEHTADSGHLCTE